MNPNSNSQNFSPNVLVTSVGRRVTLVSHFSAAVASISGGQVIVTDRNPTLSAACHVVDQAIEVPSVLDPSYPKHLLALCREHEVSLIVPTIDTELLVLAELRDMWLEEHGIRIAISDLEFIRNCRNKRATADLFAQIGIKTPRELDINSDVFPRFIKPISGSRSVDLHTVYHDSEILERLRNSDEFIHQELVDRKEFQEYTVDVYYNLDGSLGCVVPRLRLEVRDGEVSKGKTHKGLLLPFLESKLSNLTGAFGCITTQFFVRENSDEAEVLGIEINPRFGGGYPLTHAAGGQYVDWLVAAHFTGSSVSYSDSWIENMTMLRYDAEVFSVD